MNPLYTNVRPAPDTPILRQAASCDSFGARSVGGSRNLDRKQCSLSRTVQSTATTGPHTNGRRAM